MKYEPNQFADHDSSRANPVRANVSITCEVRQGTRPWRMTRLEDISPEGFRIAWLPGCHKDTPLRIRIPGLQVLSADIRWKQGDALGCQFTAPLYIAVFEHIVRCSEVQ